jgi:predicted O-linked N-acetylglucosamine transferase (SPINDLY family)
MNRKQRRVAGKPGQTLTHTPEGSAALLAPTSPAALFAEAFKCYRAGRLPEAESWCRRGLAAQPDHPDALHLLGVIVRQAGRHDVAVQLISQAIRRNGHNPFYFYNLGNALDALDRREEAAAAYRQAIAVKPDFAEALSNLGDTLTNLGKLDEAIAALRRAIGFKPDYPEAYSNLGVALQIRGKLNEAVAAFRQAIGINPGSTGALCNFGNALMKQGKFDEAIAALGRAIAVKPDYAEAYSNLGAALQRQGKLEEAIAACRRAIAVKPDYAEAYSNLGAALQRQGKLDEAIAAYRQAIAVDPDYAQAHSNLAFCLNYVDRVAAEDVFAAHRDWGSCLARQTPRPSAYANDRQTGRRLRIGYVSPDFRQHSVSYFFEPLLKEHDRRAVEAFCYAEVARPDRVTARLEGLADGWRTTVGLSDAELAERVRADGVDILIDLAGHTENNRLGVFARKPAPVQATWLGYPNTTGLEVIDYRLVDAVTDPEGEADALASETLVRLADGFLCYSGLPDAPEPAPPPCLEAGAVTFGSANNAAKVSASVFDAWARLLVRLPEARLLLKGRQFGDAATRALFLARLGERGVAADRVELLAWLPDVAAHLAVYHRIDVALDPFPYNGATTTCEAMWMGVPVVTLRGDRHAGRVGASLLSQVGLNDLIADTVGEYVDIAVALASDRERLADLRRSLRSRMAVSPLCDGPAFARKLEAAFRRMWLGWCETPSSQE